MGGVKGPIIDPFAAGFQAGVKEVNPKATVEMKWLSDQADQKAFANPPGGKTAATALYDDGADIVFHASGLSGNGVFEAAAADGASSPSAWTPTSTSRRPRTSSRTS